MKNSQDKRKNKVSKQEKIFKQKKPKRRLNRLGKVVVSTIAVVFALLLVVRAFISNKINRINIVDDSDFTKVSTTSTKEDKDKQPEESKNQASEKSLYELNAALRKDLPDGVLYDEDIFNILLIGVDSRDKDNLQTNSDSMMLASLDLKHKKIHLISLLRDSYVYIPGYGYHKLNAANALGGPPLLLETIRENYRIEVEHYALVNMFDVVKIVDLLDGVKINIKDYEIEELNRAIKSYNGLIGEKHPEDFIYSSGVHTLNGRQALAYGRIRKVGNSDYERTERQRRIIGSLFKKMQSLDLLEVNSLINNVLPLINTNLKENEMLSFIPQLGNILSSELIPDRIPIDYSFEETYIDGLACLVVDFNKNISYLAENIYNMSDAEIAEFFDNSVEMTEPTY